MMAQEVQPPSDPKRVKVYELRDNDWFDRGTGFCTGQILDVRLVFFSALPFDLGRCALADLGRNLASVGRAFKELRMSLTIFA